MNYSEMSDFEINFQIALLQGYHTNVRQHFGEAGLSNVKTTEGSLDYCNSWADAGPIIEKENISLTCHQSRDEWAAIFNRHAMAAHTKPLRAAMVCYLMKKEREDAA
ncbi:phage protein NinX family protein [Pantoea eucalypti]|uniref:phage protein NinX family protein n=1 Tax=Pantoea eucalypti TaxID=470933 RepID=UPI003EE7E692